MSKCWNCGLTLVDPSQVCPLCKCIVEPKAGEEGLRTYPYMIAEKGIKKMQMALNIYLFAAIVAECILIFCDIKAHGSPAWVIMIGGFLAYAFVTLKVSIQMPTGYRFKVLLQTLLGVGVLILIDIVSGFHGWSLNYVLPAAFIFLDVAILILMIVNMRNWQSYMPMQMLVIVFSIGPWVLYHFGLVTAFYVPLIASGFAILSFVGTLIIGGKRARTELYRRFHV